MHRHTLLLLILIFLIAFGALPFLVMETAMLTSSKKDNNQTANFIDVQNSKEQALQRIKPAKEIKALYATWGTVSRLSRVDSLIETIERAGYNALVVNVKDNDGKYMGENVKPVVHKLIKAGIYPIARIVVFQDAYLAKTQPQLALTQPDGSLFRDSGGYLWVDPAHPIVQAYNIEITKRAIDLGFSEINLDYVRFPSDGNLKEVVYPYYNDTDAKEVVLENFFRYYRDSIKSYSSEVVISADIFGYTFLRSDGLGIGQRLDILAKYFDVLAPMIYPSHFAPGNFGFPNPAEEPYEVIKRTLESGFRILETVTSTNVIIRPWIQDFDMGAHYNRERFQAQISAIRDSGLNNGFFVWNPSNKYDLNKIREESLHMPKF